MTVAVNDTCRTLRAALHSGAQDRAGVDGGIAPRIRRSSARSCFSSAQGSAGSHSMGERVAQQALCSISGRGQPLRSGTSIARAPRRVACCKRDGKAASARASRLAGPAGAVSIYLIRERLQAAWVVNGRVIR